MEVFMASRNKNSTTLNWSVFPSGKRMYLRTECNRALYESAGGNVCTARDNATAYLVLEGGDKNTHTGYFRFQVAGNAKQSEKG